MSIKINIPIAWNELSARQIKIIANCSVSKLPTIYLDYKIFLALLDIKWFHFIKKWKVLKIIKHITLKDLKKHYEWVYNTIGLTKFIQTIKSKTARLFAPSERINNLTINEFAHADDLYFGWLNTSDFEYLQYLAAVLYREKDVLWKRLPFDKTELDKRASELDNIKQDTLLAIALSYQGSRQYLIEQFPNIFPKQKDSKNKKLPQNSGLGKLVLHLSGGKFGTHNETKSTNVYTFFSEFEEQLKSKPYE